jgi:hypothetical protein
VTEQEHKEFYQFIAKAYDSPQYTLHFMTDMPLILQALFYVPETHMEKVGEEISFFFFRFCCCCSCCCCCCCCVALFLLRAQR